MDNKEIVFITGGAGNIARATIQKYLDNNCIVIATDIHEENSNSEFAKNSDYSYYKCDVTNVDDIENLKKQIEQKYNRLTHIISMAGKAVGTDHDGIENVTIEDINKTIEINLLSHIYITRILLPLLKNDTHDKTITYVSSINALRAWDMPIYSAAKSGLYGLTKGSLQKLGAIGIRINTISPGTIPFPWEIEENKKTNGELLGRRPKIKYKDFAYNTDIADSLYAITHVMKKIVGQDIVIDAGQMA